MGWGNPYVGKVDLSSCLGGTQRVAGTVSRSAFGGGAGGTSYSCSVRKTCGQMSSCEEARFHLQQCGNSRLDGNSDGVPCESLCR
ncbi:Excalibur calcium-binding domain protein [compost metagenome]